MATRVSFLSEGCRAQMDPRTQFNVDQDANTPKSKDIKEISEISNQQVDTKQSSIAFEIIKTYSDRVIGRQIEILYEKETGVFAHVISSDNRITRISKEWISGIQKEIITYPQKMKVFLQSTYVTLGYMSDVGYHVYLNHQIRGGKINDETNLNTQTLDGRVYIKYLNVGWGDVSIHDKGIVYAVDWAEENGYEILCTDPTDTDVIKEDLPNCKCYVACATDTRVTDVAEKSGHRPDLILKKDGYKDIIVEVERITEKNTQHSKDQIKSFSDYQARYNASVEFWVIWVT
ncbi:MAG: hypothetical protein AB7H48_07855 [Parachlamydiales bacterium]